MTTAATGPKTIWGGSRPRREPLSLPCVTPAGGVAGGGWRPGSPGDGKWGPGPAPVNVLATNSRTTARPMPSQPAWCAGGDPRLGSTPVSWCRFGQPCVSSSVARSCYNLSGCAGRARERVTPAVRALSAPAPAETRSRTRPVRSRNRCDRRAARPRPDRASGPTPR